MLPHGVCGCKCVSATKSSLLPGLLMGVDVFKELVFSRWCCVNVTVVITNTMDHGAQGAYL